MARWEGDGHRDRLVRNERTLPGDRQIDAGGGRSSAKTEDPGAAVRRIVMDDFERTTALLQQRREALERGARELLARETLDEAALKLPAVPHAASG
jgi:hypothetical protein